MVLVLLQVHCSSQGYHTFYNSSNNVITFNIDSVGNISSAGACAVDN